MKTSSVKTKATPSTQTCASFPALLKLQSCLPIKPELVNELVRSIREHGLQEPIKRLRGVVIDGRHRELACRKAGIKPRYVELGLASAKTKDGDPVADMFVAHNLVRNHLTLGERALLAASYANLGKGANQHTAEAGRFSRKVLAKTFAVSEDSIDRSKMLLDSGRTDLIDNVKRGGSPTQAVRVLEVEQHGAKAARIARRNGSAKAVMKALKTEDLNIDIFLADPPWKFSNGASTSLVAPEQHYPTMTLDAIKAMPIPKLAAKNALCWLWVPNFMIPQGLEVLKAWGFGSHVTSMVWVKPTQCPTPGAVLACHETLLIGMRGTGLPVPRKGIPRARSWHQAKVQRHSQKPDYFAQQIERLYPKAAKMELFCRSPRKGWLAWGNEIVGKVACTNIAANDDTFSVAKSKKSTKAQSRPSTSRCRKAA